MSISSSAMLVDFNVSTWTAHKGDKEATKRVLHTGDQAIKVAELRKNLMAGNDRIAEINTLRNQARAYHYKHTLPWSNEGTRMLPALFFFDYKDTMDGFIARFEPMADAFAADYPQLRLGTQQYLHELGLDHLYKPSDYPHEGVIRSLFSMRCVYSPVPESGDFRIDAEQRELDALKQQYEAAFNDRLAAAMEEPKAKLTKMLKDMSNKLAGDGETKQRWYDSFLGNAQELADLLRGLNLTGDEELEEARRKFASAISQYDMEDIKEDEGAREDLKDDLDKILDDYRW